MKIIDIKGVIVPNDDKRVYEWLELDAVCPRDVAKVLDTAKPGEAIEVYINSPGGDVYAGSEIYSRLKEYPGTVTVKITGIAASAASVIAMAGDRVLIGPTAQIMIHNAWTVTAGDHNAMEHMAGVLTGTNLSMANSYAIKTGLALVDLLKLMDATTYFTAQEAVRLKFADAIMFSDPGDKARAQLQALKAKSI
jgi:ATP-dependent protease ClpP protease subunit